MKPVHLKVARIGNSRGVRIPATTLERYHIGASVVMEELSDGILLRPVGHSDAKLSWDETAKAMAAEPEDWTEWDTTPGGGIDELAWESPPRPRLVAEEGSPEYKAPRRSRKK
jgi:antitoxin component of MazEF toxin-antitoxin module